MTSIKAEVVAEVDTTQVQCKARKEIESSRYIKQN